MNSAERALIQARPAAVASRGHRRILEAELSARCASRPDDLEGWSFRAYAATLLLSAAAAVALIAGMSSMNHIPHGQSDPALRALAAEMSRGAPAPFFRSSAPASALRTGAPSRQRVTAFVEQRLLLEQLLHKF